MIALGEAVNLLNKQILVTGAGGFIGSHLTEDLVKHGFDVRAFVHYNSSNSWAWLDYLGQEITKTLLFLLEIFAIHMTLNRL